MPLHRPYIRNDVRTEVEKRAPKNENGQFLDANTGKPIEGSYDLGHKPGHEHWREVEKAEKEGLSQEQFNNRMNNPDYYQIEDPHENRSHVHELKKETSSTESSSTPSQVENEAQNKDTVRGQKPIEGQDNVNNNNSITRGEKPKETIEPTVKSNVEQNQRGALPKATDAEPSKSAATSSSDSTAKVSTSSGSTKAADEASKVASDQAAKNTVAKTNGIGV